MGSYPARADQLLPSVHRVRFFSLVQENVVKWGGVLREAFYMEANWLLVYTAQLNSNRKQLAQRCSMQYDDVRDARELVKLLPWAECVCARLELALGVRQSSNSR